MNGTVTNCWSNAAEILSLVGSSAVLSRRCRGIMRS